MTERQDNFPQIPKGWVWTTLEAILLTLESGKRPKGGVRHIKTGIPSIGGEHLLYNGGFDLTNIRYVPTEFYENMSRGKILKKDVLVVKDGATTDKTAFVSDAFPCSKAAVNEHVFIMRVFKEYTEPKYLFFWMQSPFGQECVKDNFKGTAQGGINSLFIRNSKFPFPPFPEQHRIVSSVEELLTKLGAGVKSLKNVKTRLQRYLQAVMKYAFEGKLTEEWRKTHKQEIEPASTLLKRIRKEQNKKEKRKYKDYQLIEPSDSPRFQGDWVWTTLTNISEKITDGEHLRPDTIKKGVYFLSAKDVREDGVHFDNPLFVSEEDAVKFRRKCNPEKSDILLVSRGATIGRSCIIKTNKRFCLLGSVILIKLSNEINNEYIRYLFKWDKINRHMIELSGSTAQQAIYLRDVRKLEIPIPSIAEQNIIVGILDNVFMTTNQVSNEINSSILLSINLKQSILKKAFEGRLIPQDPTDEPAGKLLERIREEKEKRKSEKKGKKKGKSKGELKQLELVRYVK